MGKEDVETQEEVAVEETEEKPKEEAVTEEKAAE